MSAAPQVSLAAGVRPSQGCAARSPKNDNQAPRESVETSLLLVDPDAAYWSTIKDRATD